MTNTKTTRNAFLASVLSLVLCASMLVGSTFAWFTDTATTGVNTIKSGRLDVALEMLVDGEWVDAEGKTLGFVDDEGNVLTDILWEPGCSYLLQPFRIVNKGNLALKFDVIVSGLSGDIKLAEAIEYGLLLGDVNNLSFVAYGKLDDFNSLFDAVEDASLTRLKPGETFDTAEYGVTFHMREDAGNEYQGLTLSGMSITVSATQDTVESDSYDNMYDAEAPDLTDDKGNILINDIAALFSFANKVNAGDTYKGKTVLLNADIDLAGINWTPIGNAEKFPSVTFAGTFDGQNHTISNMNTVSLTANHAAAGLFGSIIGTVKNVVLDNATVISSHYAGGIVGYCYGAVEGCTVKNSAVTSAPELINGEYDNGDKVGGVVGYLVKEGTVGTVSGNTVENVTVTAYRDLGGVVGYANDNTTVTNNTAKNVTLVVDKAHNYKGYITDDQYDANAVIGEKSASATVSGNTESGIKTGNINVTVENQSGLNEVLDGNTVVEAELPKGEYTLPALSGKDVTISGDKDTVIDTTTSMPSTNGAKLTFKGVTLEFKDGTNYQGFTHAEGVVFEDCVINGTMFLYSDTEFINCTFNSNGNYNVWTYGSNATFIGCTFNTQGRAILVYNGGEVHATVKAEDCTFNATATYSSPKAAIEVGKSDDANSPTREDTTYEIIINNCKADAEHFFANQSTSNLWGNKNSMDENHLKVTVDGTVVYGN